MLLDDPPLFRAGPAVPPDRSHCNLASSPVLLPDWIVPCTSGLSPGLVPARALGWGLDWIGLDDAVLDPGIIIAGSIDMDPLRDYVHHRQRDRPSAVGVTVFMN
ncbi:hypothetical protein PENVUL_c023G01244 [Penicillium vulpinum]|uniref:Uncharacterized protein n=1 Tax=Penicillium vulpinum TaxID=29845 RepID=A0A1V6RVX1_9EURO|nr:hypothetical protein PENVUL_c023G01244 [Penicillium vulpinum]